MPLAAALALGATVVSAGSQIYSANKAAKASQKATDQVAALQNQTRSEVQPFVSAGTDALRRLQDPNTLLRNFQESPDYL